MSYFIRHIILFFGIIIFPISTLAQKNESRLGSTNTIFKVLAVINNIKPESEFSSTPKKGFRFLAVRVEFDNTKSDKEMRIGDFAISVRDDEGNTYPAYTLYPYPALMTPYLQDENLASGDFVKGWVSFEVPKQLSYAKLRIKFAGMLGSSKWIPLSNVPTK